jgi:hypothetical protein
MGRRTAPSEIITSLVQMLDCERLFQKISDKNGIIKALQEAELRIGRVHDVMKEIVGLQRSHECTYQTSKGKEGPDSTVLHVAVTFPKPKQSSRFQITFDVGGSYPFGRTQTSYRKIYGQVDEASVQQALKEIKPGYDYLTRACKHLSDEQTVV